jgi:hypothetical protein
MPSYRLHLDSRSRDTHTLTYAPTFSLTRTICNVKQVRVKHVQIANTIHNIRADFNDQISISVDAGVTFETYTYLTPGFYSGVRLVASLNTFLQGLSGLSGVVTLDAANSKLNWSLPDNVLVDGRASTTRDILGLNDEVYDGTYETLLFLAAPMSISFVCPQLQSTYNVFSSQHRMARIEPFLTLPLVSGYNTMEYFAPRQMFTIELGKQTLSTLDFRVVDTISGTLLTELSQWSMELEITN